MDINDYIESNRSSKKSPAEIAKRWNERIVPRSLHLAGSAGADQYVADYGKKIGVEKLIELARKSEAEQANKMAMRFWAHAYSREYGVQLDQIAIEGGLEPALIAASSTPVAVKLPEIECLPDSLQPGRFITLQPIDATGTNTSYANDPDYWGQPKRDGNRLVILATPSGIFYQSRSTELRHSPSLEMEAALVAAVEELGTFVLDGELYYRSAIGSEHRTGSQAATINIENDQGDAPTPPTYAIFKALYAKEMDLRLSSEGCRMAVADIINAALPKMFELVPTAQTTEEKLALIKQQKSQGREGEIWIRHADSYRGGKSTGSIFRTKYLQELEVFIKELTTSKAADRPFKSALVVDEKGKSLGSVGTGFDQSDLARIKALHEANPGTLKIKVRFQGFTENGKLWHARFLEIVN